MPAKVVDILIARRDELESMAIDWSQIKAWHSRTRPVIAEHYSNQLDAFDKLVVIRFSRGMRVMSLGGGSSNNDFNRQARAADQSANNKKIATARSQMLAHVNALIELEPTIEADDVDTYESDTLFDEIEQLISASHLPSQWKSVVRSDIDEAQVAYRAGGFKGCVVLLGAALEGLMLGILQRSDVIAALSGGTLTVPACLQRLGTGHPNFADKIADDLGFEDYKVCIHELVPGIDGMGVDNIQAFRNAIHPWKAIQEPTKYREFDQARALHYIASYQKIAEVLHDWTP